MICHMYTVWHNQSKLITTLITLLTYLFQCLDILNLLLVILKFIIHYDYNDSAGQ
jgi:hypothetical protein